MSTDERPTLSVAETTALLGISRWLVEQAVHDGSLPSVRVGRHLCSERATSDRHAHQIGSSLTPNRNASAL